MRIRHRAAVIGVLVMALLLAGCTGSRPPGPGDAASTHPVTRAAATAAPVDIAAATVRSGAAEDRIGRSRIEHLEVDGATVVAPVDRGTDRWQLRRSTDAGRTWTESSVQGLAGIDATMIGADVRLLAHRPGQWLLLLHDPADASSRYTVATSADGAVFRVVGSRLDVRADETVERVLGTRSGWVLVTSAVRADRPDLLRTRRSADGGHWDGAVEIRPTVDDFILTAAAATTDRIALGGVTVRGPLADGVFRGAIVTSTDGGRTFAAPPPVNPDDDYARVDALQYAGDTLAASVEASHPDLDVRTEWAQFRGDTVTRDVVDEVRRAPAGGAFVTGTDPVNETRALSLSGGSRLLVQSIGDRAQRHTEVHLAGPGTAPFSPVTLPPEPAGNERFIRAARPVPGGHLLVWNDYAGGGVRSRVLFVDPSGRTTERTPALPDEGTPRSATVSGPVGGDGAPLLGSIGRQAVLLAGPPARTLTVQATVTLPDGYRVDRVAAGAGGYLATGWKQYSLRPAPAIFTSRDGVTWRTGSGDPLEARHRGTDLDLTGAVRAGSAWVVVGTETAERVTRGVALVSRDGSSWSPLRPRALDGTVTADTRVTALTAGRAGRVLAGGSVTTRDGWRPAVFPGGETAVSWGRILLRLPAGSVSGAVDQLVADGTHRLASGSCPTRTGDRHCVWTSADQGVTWRPAMVVRAADPTARVVSVDPFATGRRPGIAVVEEKAGQRSVGIVAVDADGGYGRRLPVDTGAFSARSTTMLAAVLGRGNLLLSGTTGPGAGEHAVTTVQPIDPAAFAPPAGGPNPSSSPSPSSSRGSSGSGGSG